MKLCSIPNCSNKHKSRGLCNTHYQYWIRKQKAGDGWTECELRSFWSKVSKSPHGCWNWTAHTDKGGYGTLSVGASPCKSHRFSWMIHRGAIPEGLGVLHKCDNPRCVNPDHLFLGTNTDNTEDRDAKGRQVQGDRHPDAKLTSEDVKEIRSVFVPRSRKTGARALARKFGVAKSTLLGVVNRTTWKGVP